MIHRIVVDLLLGGAVLLTLVCALGVWVMPDPFQKLHFIAPAATLTPMFLAAAVFMDEPNRQAGFKTVACCLLLAAMNGVVTHATARAFRIREHGRWTLEPSEDGRR